MKSAQKKKHYKVYKITTLYNDLGEITVWKDFAGETWAVSPEKARCNVEYRIYGKSIYTGGYDVDLGQENGMEVRYEAIEA